MNRPFPLFCLALCALAGPGAALDLSFPGPATPAAERTEPLTSYRLPIGPFGADGVPARLIEGALAQTAWRIAAPGLTTLQLLQPLRAQLAAAGYSVIFECEAAACGGFDFRYGTDVLPEPDMHVDLGDYRYLAAERTTPEGPEYLSLIVSRAVDLGFVQVTRVGPGAAAAPTLTASTKSGSAAPVLLAQPVAEAPVPLPAPIPSGSLADRLATQGAQVLEGVQFASGTAALAGADAPALAELAAFLRADPQRRVMLVGHTDASGGLEGNIALSRQRAQAVRARLIDGFGVPARQIEAQGVGFLAPRAPNDTEAGRTANRRVEAILLADDDR